MQGLLIVIIFLVACACAIWIIDAISTSNRELMRQPEVIKKVEERASRMSKKELIFKQFGAYVLKLYQEKNSIHKSDLLNILRCDFPYYKDGYLELFYDLKESQLIEKATWDYDYYELGKSYQNIVLLYPDLLAFMKEKCKNFDYDINITDEWEVFEAEINTRKKFYEPNIYFAFGTCSGKNIAQKVWVQNETVNSKSMYIYGKSYCNDYHRNDLEKIVTQYYCELNANIDYKKQFLDWMFLCIRF